MNHRLDKGTAEQQAKESLFSAAVALFAEKGYASTSVREIVASAGVTKPVLYYYFESKEGLFRTILDWAARRKDPGPQRRKAVRCGMPPTRIARR